MNAARVPSVKAIMAHMRCSKFTADAAHTIMKAVDTAERASVAMDGLNAIFGMHGVEALRSEADRGGYWWTTCALHLNSGDSYNPTIVYETSETYHHVFRLTSLGDWVESPAGRKAKVL